MIRGAIFDMDGLLIDSEPFWQDAEIDVFGSVGIALSHELCANTVGMKIEDTVNYWYQQFPWTNKTIMEVQDEIINGVKDRIMANGNLMEGALEVIEFLRRRNLKLAVASSSTYVLINTVVDKFGLREHFDFVYSAEDELHGKPHPGIYMTTCQKLNIHPNDCIAFEDSLSGLISAKSARVKAVAVPEKAKQHLTCFDFADIKLNSLSDFSETEFSFLNLK